VKNIKINITISRNTDGWEMKHTKVFDWQNQEDAKDFIMNGCTEMVNIAKNMTDFEERK
jgi:hypothetical protein